MILDIKNNFSVMRTSVPALNVKDGRNFRWDYIILDEAHQIKVTNVIFL